ncbi:MAG: glycosyltransferase family 2 protein [Firmicutes bacterium]|nr:glycosyltransferase family 2 protein [Bacillota bacterium]
METIKLINFIIATVFFVCYSYQFAYILVPYLKKEKPHKPAELHRYAVLISARNKELVIGNLLDSISAQDYPSSLVRVFVVADNCTDKTAKVARAHGAIVYERFNDKLVGKGYALEYLLDRIGEEYGDVFDAYMVFDADNLLSEDYISRMNETFSDGYRIITSYRNSKNYGDNWISAGYALWFLREAKYLNNARYLLGTSCAVSGTGFMFSREILKSCGGWPFHLLVEDIEFTIHNIVSGEKVGYCPRAVLYDEQPTKFSQSWKQRMRWARGYIQILRKYGGRLLHGIFAKRSFSCFDMTMNIAPAVILSFLGIIINVGAAVYSVLNGGGTDVLLQSFGQLILNTCLMMFIIGAITTISEWKNIYCSTPKKILYAFTFPLFMLTYLPICIVALFRPVKWEPIVHDRVRTLREVRGEGNAA